MVRGRARRWDRVLAAAAERLLTVPMRLLIAALDAEDLEGLNNVRHVNLH